MARPFSSWNAYAAFEVAVRYNARFFHDRKVRAFLSTVAATAESRITILGPKKSIWRAQIGHSWIKQSYGDAEIEAPAPFPDERMKPLRTTANEGRVNPRGIPCLYGANTRETAVAEVRPWVGALVSLAQLRPARDLRLVNCGGDPEIEHEIWFEQPSPEEREKIVWRAIGRAFSNPASPDPGIAEYAPTQILAEHFKNSGYDGILFRSSLGPGLNVALFDLDSVSVSSVSLAPVLGVKYAIGDDQSFHVKKHFKRVK
jgi:RES domain